MLDLDLDINEKKYKIVDYEQGSEEWLQWRAGKINASNFKGLMGKGSTRDGLILTKAAEIITNSVDEYGHNFKSAVMVRGNEIEHQAREAYEKEYSVSIETVGGVELDSFVSCSPDGFVSDNGLVEFKCPDNKNYMLFIINGLKQVSNTRITQMQMQMYITDREWCDYVVYNHNFDNNMKVIRFERDDKYIEEIKAQIERAKGDILSHISDYKFSNNEQ